MRTVSCGITHSATLGTSDYGRRHPRHPFPPLKSNFVHRSGSVPKWSMYRSSYVPKWSTYQNGPHVPKSTVCHKNCTDMVMYRNGHVPIWLLPEKYGVGPYRYMSISVHRWTTSVHVNFGTVMVHFGTYRFREYYFGTLNDPLLKAYSITNVNRQQPNKPLYECSYERVEAYSDLLARQK